MATYTACVRYIQLHQFHGEYLDNQSSPRRLQMRRVNCRPRPAK
jgi:hypothetical protein